MNTETDLVVLAGCESGLGVTVDSKSCTGMKRANCRAVHYGVHLRAGLFLV